MFLNEEVLEFQMSSSGLRWIRRAHFGDIQLSNWISAPPITAPKKIGTMKHSGYNVQCQRATYTVFTPASTFTVFFSLIQLLLNKDSFHHSRFYLYSILFINPAST